MGIALPSYGFFNSAPTEIHDTATAYGEHMHAAIEVAKPRYTYAQFQAQQQEKCRQYTVAAIIERVLVETAASPNMKQYGDSHACSLRAMQRMPIGAKDARELSRQDIIEHCKMRRQTVKPPTVNQDMVYLGGVLDYASSTWEDCEEITRAPIVAAKPFLKKHELIGKSVPRKRVATDDERARILQLFDEQNQHPNTTINMVDFTLAGLCSTRRRGELCRLAHGDIDWDRKDAEGNATPMYLIRDVKHPTRKKGNDVWFPLFDDFAEIIKRQPRLTPDDPTERVFPYKEGSVTQRFTDGCKKLGIPDLHLHDGRRLGITHWLSVFKNPHTVRRISGHVTIVVLERHYDATDPATLHGELALLQAKGREMAMGRST